MRSVLINRVLTQIRILRDIMKENEKLSASELFRVLRQSEAALENGEMKI